VARGPADALLAALAATAGGGAGGGGGAAGSSLRSLVTAAAWLDRARRGGAAEEATASDDPSLDEASLIADLSRMEADATRAVVDTAGLRGPSTLRALLHRAVGPEGASGRGTDPLVAASPRAEGQGAAGLSEDERARAAAQADSADLRLWAGLATADKSLTGAAGALTARALASAAEAMFSHVSQRRADATMTLAAEAGGSLSRRASVGAAGPAPLVPGPRVPPHAALRVLHKGALEQTGQSLAAAARVSQPAGGAGGGGGGKPKAGGRDPRLGAEFAGMASLQGAVGGIPLPLFAVSRDTTEMARRRGATTVREPEPRRGRATGRGAGRDGPMSARGQSTSPFRHTSS